MTAVLAALLLAPPVWEAEVHHVIDGDSVAVSVRTWPDTRRQLTVRLQGIDAPELFQPRCEQERAQARAARDVVAALLPPAAPVYLSEVGDDRYGGRATARLFTQDGLDIGLHLLALGLARPYLGRGPRPGWCP